MNKAFIFADGHKACFISKGPDGSEAAYTITSPHIARFSFNIPNSNLGTGILAMFRRVDNSIVTVEAEIKCLPNDFEMIVSNEGNIMKHLTLDMFKDVSVSQMFRIINKKINERNGGKRR